MSIAALAERRKVAPPRLVASLPMTPQEVNIHLAKFGALPTEVLENPVEWRGLIGLDEDAKTALERLFL